MLKGIVKTLGSFPTGRLGCVLALVVVAATMSVAQDVDPKHPKLSFRQMITDPEDGKLDASAFLAKGGFIPVPLIISEPALGKGLGVGLAFFDYSGIPGGEDPTISVLGAAATTNGSRMVMALRSGSLRSGDFKYLAALGGGSVNLSYFPNGASSQIGFNNVAVIGYFEGRARLGDSKFFLGPSLTMNRSNITPNVGGGVLPPAFTRRLDQVALGLALTYDARDIHLTPRNGLNFNVSVKQFSPSLGSDTKFTSAKMFGAYFYSPDDNWTISGMALAQGIHGDAPFFMLPSISLRGVAYNRFQGDQVISSEVEIRRMLNSRWSVLGFAGYGVANSASSSIFSGDYDATTYGVGFRYRLARKFGMDMGIDYAFGPDGDIWYITLGHAWSRHMK